MTGAENEPILLEVYHRLYQEYGPQGWWPGAGPLDVVIGAILTQAAAWTNVEKAIQNLKASSCWSLDAIHARSPQELAEIIRPSGYFNSKARKLKAFAEHVHRNYGGSLEDFLAQDGPALRDELLSLHGIGPETADDILVYAAGQPFFVIDSYTRRILQRMGLTPPERAANYGIYQELFHQQLPQNVALFNEYHALLDQHAKRSCTKVPSCGGCCLRDLCATGQEYEMNANESALD